MTDDQKDEKLSEGLIVKFDKEFNILWRKNISILNKTELLKIEKLESGEFLVVGSSIYGEGYVGNHTTGGAILLKFDKDGEEVFRTNYGGPYSGKFNDILVEDKNFEYKNLIGYLPSEIHLYDDYTVLEMFKYSSLFYSNKELKRALELSKRLELETNKKIEDLSLGNLKKVGIVLALMHNPKLLILDEPTSGLDPIIQEEFFNILKEEKKKGTTVFFSSHVLSEIKKLCDRVGIIKEGHLIKVDTISNFNKNNYLNIHIESKDIEKISKELNIDIINNNFIYQGDINILINKLSKYKIDKLLINEPEIEELFIDYYKEEVC